MNHSQVRVAPILIREPARWDISPHFLHQSWFMLGVLWGEELRSRTSPWKVAGQLRNSILIFRTISKFRHYRKIVSFVVGLLYSILIPMYSVSSAIFQRGTAQPTWSPTHPLNCSLSLSLPSSASALLHPTSPSLLSIPTLLTAAMLWRWPQTLPSMQVQS